MQSMKKVEQSHGTYRQEEHEKDVTLHYDPFLFNANVKCQETLKKPC